MGAGDGALGFHIEAGGRQIALRLGDRNGGRPRDGLIAGLVDELLP